MLDEEFVVIDGIRVRVDSIRDNKMNHSNNKLGKESRQTERDDVIEEEEEEEEEEEGEDDEEEIDYDDEDEDLESTKHLPTKCHGKVQVYGARN